MSSDICATACDASLTAWAARLFASLRNCARGEAKRGACACQRANIAPCTLNPNPRPLVSASEQHDHTRADATPSHTHMQRVRTRYLRQAFGSENPAKVEHSA